MNFCWMYISFLIWIPFGIIVLVSSKCVVHAETRDIVASVTLQYEVHEQQMMSMSILADSIVSANSFKSRLDKFWSLHDFVYDYRASPLAARSQVSV